MSKNLVIVPTYNEIENIGLLIDKVMTLSTPFDILVIEDNSPDGTAELVKEYAVKYPDRVFMIQRQGKLGLGTAYIEGFTYGINHRYDYLCEMDADFSHNPEDLIRLHDTCENNGADVAIGSRYVHGVTVINWPIGRVLMSFFASKYVQLITGMPIEDATAGFKCYSRKVLETIPYTKVKFVGYAFQIQMKFLCWKYGFILKEVPIIFMDRTRGTSKMSMGIFKEAIFGVIMMKFKSLFQTFHPQADSK
ncbi:polyprenol monophosphomannose synthase [Cytophaga hutchinsonii]|uniref:B-glycosyltransferase, glycosyltransferase family 2 protein n=1 Tax=Cytophaga hutchinsonii (strain ATCC 33406 / DSM 1761 / CIP 103989 / NBRC 15051 / NCIMB 9469 / D465) TaxID=269798 RepID=A0A6N4SRD8_CYTH3|nr:polyprenol monophosphomannose synthase [Cytophaga hutchinsonii]ABG58844.1 b-glycosyltransferase, glycosyltransferase family 2 protein [Cytophaga hutchinsonii ATCC 33406]SFX80467.1 dolichol-phosphate mannosyltransferase [Cytophaga hutchinsonii ATCC 33406]